MDKKFVHVTRWTRGTFFSHYIKLYNQFTGNVGAKTASAHILLMQKCHSDHLICKMSVIKSMLQH